jgi:hypothetical protein
MGCPELLRPRIRIRRNRVAVSSHSTGVPESPSIPTLACLLHDSALGPPPLSLPFHSQPTLIPMSVISFRSGSSLTHRRRKEGICPCSRHRWRFAFVSAEGGVGITESDGLEQRWQGDNHYTKDGLLVPRTEKWMVEGHTKMRRER